MTAIATAARMPLGDHLREARTRVVRAAVALLIGCVVGFVFSEAILDVLRAPILEIAESRDASLNYDTVTGAFDMRLKIALFAGVVLASPVWLYELFAYLAPGLTGREKKYTFGFLAAAVPLFAAGCIGGILMFPHMVELLTSFASADDSTVLQASYYVDFVMKVVLATGIAFVLPVFLVMLNFLGILPARTLARTWRWSVVAIVVFSALVTPAADVLSMFLIAVPMTVLFLTALLIAYLHDRRDAALLAPAREEAPDVRTHI